MIDRIEAGPGRQRGVGGLHGRAQPIKIVAQRVVVMPRRNGMGEPDHQPFVKPLVVRRVGKQIDAAGQAQRAGIEGGALQHFGAEPERLLQIEPMARCRRRAADDADRAVAAAGPEQQAKTDAQGIQRDSGLGMTGIRAGRADKAVPILPESLFRFEQWHGAYPSAICATRIRPATISGSSDSGSIRATRSAVS